MIRSLTRFALGIVLGMPVSLPAQSKAVAVVEAEATLRQDEARRFAAMMQRDTATIGRHLAPELVYTHSNALVETRADHLRGIAGGSTVYDSIAPVEMSYRWIGEVAVGAGVVKSRGSIGGTPFDVTLRVTTVHVKRSGRWQLVAWQSTRIP